MNTPPELPKKTDNTPVTPAQKNTRTASFYMALLAIVISLVGTCVSIFEARILREQQTIMSEEKEASVWPFVNAGGAIDQTGEEGTTLEYKLTNEGVGPALIGDISHSVGDVQGTMFTVLPELKNRFPNLQIIPLLISNSERKVLGAGESYVVYRILIVPREGATTEPAMVAGELSSAYCYCSIYGDCWSSEGERLHDDESCGGRNYLR